MSLVVVDALWLVLITQIAVSSFPYASHKSNVTRYPGMFDGIESVSI